MGEDGGNTIFYYVDSKAQDSIPNLPSWFDQLGSFDKSHILKQLDGVLAPFVLERRVAVERLADLLRRHGIRTVHLLHIDTEGHDYEVLRTLDFAEIAPVAIFIEHKHLTQNDKAGMRRLLRSHGSPYTIVAAITSRFIRRQISGCARCREASLPRFTEGAPGSPEWVGALEKRRPALHPTSNHTR